MIRIEARGRLPLGKCRDDFGGGVGASWGTSGNASKIPLLSTEAGDEVEMVEVGRDETMAAN